jgi:predicted RND superfamily exporter protein
VKWFSNFILSKARGVALAGALFAVLGAYYSVQLYKNLRTDIQELLPTTARSVIDLKEVTERLESIDNLGVLLFCQDTHASKRFVIDLAKNLDRYPKSVIASVDYRIDKELKFFKDRQALYIDLPDLIRVKKYIRDRIDYETELYNPLNIFRSSELPEPKLDFLVLKKKYSGRTSGFERFPEGFYATPDATKRALLVNIPGNSSGIDRAKALREAVEKTIAELNPQSYSPDLVIKFTGGVEDSIEEQEALVADLELSTVLVMIVVTIGMLAFYKSFRATAALMTSLLMGTFWTFGISYFVVGYLNANSAFLGSIVLGNGVNFGIIYLARYIEERRQNRNNYDANVIAMKETATSTWTAALAAGLSYGSLVLTGFRGFKQFGIIGLIGMILCWLSAFTILPAFLTLLDKIMPFHFNTKKSTQPIISGAISRMVGRFPRLIWGASLLATLASLVTLTQFSPDILETNLSKLRNKESMLHGSMFLSTYLDEIFQRYLSPLVILPHSRENARTIATKLRQIKAEEGPHSLIASVQTLDDFIPTQQQEKIQVLRQIRDLLPPRLLSRLSAKDQELVKEFLTDQVLRPITQADLPPLILSKFTEKDGSVGKMVLVEPPLTNETWQGQNLIQFVERLRATADAVESDAPVAGSLTITSDMIEAISQDGPKATVCAFFAVIVLVVLLFRKPSTIGWVLFSLLLGVLWLAGLILGFDLKINFLNFIALPITFGIGVDYGVNIFQRYKNGHEDILDVIVHTGGAVGLCSFSTIVGYMSLLLAGNQGFVSFGLLAVAGEITCVIAAVISLPAYLRIRDLKKR